ncbi:hypothetical protein [Caulobacter sp. 17J65-9]|uniref:hypothetical protein n=1 Tax=Caulobacter sp. 17J65-9 TaxID=2709382 RepID=UPI0013CB812B|nr:hypothetical protein [Caulobacter sp. 17J65-9]NEX91946.1 hypothetical protein [Caulobacter sp. 17J65-9]
MSAVFHLSSIALFAAAFACWFARTPLGPVVQDALAPHLVVLAVACSITGFLFTRAGRQKGRGLRLIAGADVLAIALFVTASGFGIAEAFGLHDTPTWIYGLLWGAGLLAMTLVGWIKMIELSRPKPKRA